jgi:hypothetical protein
MANEQERLKFERWYAANRMQLYMHLDIRLRCAIEDTARECWMEGIRQSTELQALKSSPPTEPARDAATKPFGSTVPRPVRQIVTIVDSEGNQSTYPVYLADATDDYINTLKARAGRGATNQIAGELAEAIVIIQGFLTMPAMTLDQRKECIDDARKFLKTIVG